MIEQAGQAAYDGQAQARARLVHGARQTHELAEDGFVVGVGNAAPGVADEQLHRPAPSTRPHQHPAGIRIADSVGQQILQHGTQQVAVGRDPQAAGHHGQVQTLGLGYGCELAAQFVEQPAQRQPRDIGPHAAGLQLGQVQQGGQQTVGAVDGAVRVDGQGAAGRVFQRRLLLQGGDEQAGGVQRLQQVVAGGGQEPGLGGSGVLGHAPSLVQSGGAVRHARLQPFVGLFQLTRGLAQGGDVGVAGGVAAAGDGRAG